MRIESPPVNVHVPVPVHVVPARSASPFARLVSSIGHEMDQGESLTRAAIAGGGRDLGPSELIALQAGVYRYREAVDLAAKLVDRATSGIKTVIQGQ
jgi:hypothetical protein